MQAWFRRLTRLGLPLVLLALSAGRPAVAEPSPDISCPPGGGGAEFASLDAMAPPVVAELARRMALPEGARIATYMAPRDAAWQVTDVVVEPLPGRRFIRGDQVGSRWFIWYESGGIAHRYHVAIFDLPPAAPAARLVAHVLVRLVELCPKTHALLQPQGTEGIDSDPDNF
jgi:hypothetical protein